MPIVAVQDAEFAYGKTQVLRGLNLQIDQGEVVAVLGPNGAGKTTLVELLIGTLAPAAGAVRVLGIDPRRASTDFWTRIGLVQQHWTDHQKWQVRDQLQWVAAAHESAGAQVRGIDDVLEAVDMLEKKTSRLGKLSGGQRRRVDIATALLPNPELLLLDEPTSGLDPVAKAQIHDVIGQATDRGATTLLTTHDLAEAEKVASRIVIVDGGRIVASGSARELRSELVGRAQVVWHHNGTDHVHATDEVEAFVATLPLAEISGLTITRPTLEDAYMALVGHPAAQSAGDTHAGQLNEEVSR